MFCSTIRNWFWDPGKATMIIFFEKNHFMSLKKSCGKLSCRVSALQKVPSTPYVSLSLFTPFLLFLFTKTYELYRLTSLSRTQLQKKNPSHEKKRRTLRPPPLLLVKRRVGCWNIQIFLSGGGFGACIMQSHPSRSVCPKRRRWLQVEGILMLRNYGSMRDYGAELKSWSVKFVFFWLVSVF